MSKKAKPTCTIERQRERETASRRRREPNKPPRPFRLGGWTYTKGAGSNGRDKRHTEMERGPNARRIMMMMMMRKLGLVVMIFWTNESIFKLKIKKKYSGTPCCCCVLTWFLSTTFSRLPPRTVLTNRNNKTTQQNPPPNETENKDQTKTQESPRHSFPPHHTPRALSSLARLALVLSLSLEADDDEIWFFNGDDQIPTRDGFTTGASNSAPVTKMNNRTKSGDGVGGHKSSLCHY